MNKIIIRAVTAPGIYNVAAMRQVPQPGADLHYVWVEGHACDGDDYALPELG